MPKYSNIVIHGWTMFAHPLFLDHVEALIEQVEGLKAKDSINYVKKMLASDWQR